MNLNTVYVTLWNEHISNLELNLYNKLVYYTVFLMMHFVSLSSIDVTAA